MLKVSLKPPQLLSSFSGPVNLAVHLPNAARMASLCCTGSWGLSQCSSASPLLGLPLQRPIGHSSFSVARRQPSQSLRQHSIALAPTSPAPCPWFNFILIRSIEKDIFSRSKGHSEHERNSHRAGAGDVIPAQKVEMLSGMLWSLGNRWPEAPFGDAEICKQSAVWILGQCCPE